MVLAINPVTRHRRSICLRDYDYALAGAYFITIVTRERRCLFGDVIDSEMRLNHWGEIVQREWEQSARIRSEIGLDTFVVMPNHVHGIIVITDASERATSRSPLHSGPTKRSLGAFVGGFKSAVTKSIRELRGELGALIWQRNYFAHIIGNEESLTRIRQYIDDNPTLWEFDRGKSVCNQIGTRKSLAPGETGSSREAIMQRWLIVNFVVIFILPAICSAQTIRPSTLAELAVYNGPDREQLLLAGAKKEGKVVWYTALAGGSYRELARAFEAKYGVPVEAYRGASRDLIAKVLAESQAKKFIMDVAESSPPLLMLMRAMKRLTPFSVPYLAKFSADSKEETGNGMVLWATDRESYMGFAYNRQKLPASAVPRNYDDLLNPALKGRMAMVTTDTGSRTVGAMLRTKGEEFLRQLRGQEITMHSVSGQALNDMIISGEVEASPTIFRNHALVAAAKGAPVAWVPMDIVPASAGSAGLSAQAPHPHGAVLFLDFLFSPEGQKILESFAYGSAVKEYGFKRWYIEKGMSIEQLERESDRWEKGLRGLAKK